VEQRTVLIVEDDDAIRDTLQLVLEEEGYRVLQAPDGQAALEIIPTLSKATVILLDLRMPRLDGAGALRDLADHPDKRDRHPIFLITANMAQLSPELVQLLGSQGVPVLPKPFDLDRLKAQVQSAFTCIEQAE
jgi:CheY-like chemotaxis protein